MFAPIIDHPATTGAGRVGGYVPQGASPFAPDPHVCNQGGLCVLHNGDPVRVESAWDRGDGFVLLYVRSVVTREATHIPEADYLAIDRIIVGSPERPVAWATVRERESSQAICPGCDTPSGFSAKTILPCNQAWHHECFNDRENEAF